MDLTKPFTINQWKISPALNTLERDGAAQTVTPKVMKLLILLLEHQGQPVSQQVIFDTLWPDQVVSDASIYQAVAQLRKAFKDDKQLIERISGQGYRISCTPSPVANTTTKARLAIPVALFTTLVILTLLWFFSQQTPHSSEHKGYRSLTLSPISFEDPAFEQQAANVSDQLLTSLVPISSLTVIHHQDNQQQVSSDLRLSGRLYGQNGVPHLALSITDTDNNEVVWAKLYTAPDATGERQNLGYRQDVLAFFDQQDAALSPAPDEDYLLARYLWRKRTPDSLKKAQSIFEGIQQQGKLSPLAAVGLCETYYFRYLYDNLSFDQVNNACEPLLNQALQQTPDLGQALAAKANLLTRQENYQQAESLFEQAIERAPNYALGHFWYGYLLREQGHYESSLEKILHAYRLAPMSPAINLGLAYAYLNLRQQTKAREYYHRAITLEPENLHAPVIELDFYPLNSGRARQLIRWAQANPKALTIQPNYQLTHIMINLAIGQYQTARRLFDGIQTRQLNPAYRLYVESVLHSVENNPSKALESLRLRYLSLGEKPIYLMPYATQLAASGFEQQAKQLLLKHHKEALTDVTDITPSNRFLLVFWFSLHDADYYRQHNALTAKLDQYFSTHTTQLAALWWAQRGDKQKVAAYLAQAQHRELNDFNQDHLLLWRDEKLRQFVGDSQQH